LLPVLPQDLADVALGGSSAIRLKVFVVSSSGATPGTAVQFSASLQS
jgi:uncharacterized membrane protein YdjX (TVP38/TMEM64 family)